MKSSSLLTLVLPLVFAAMSAVGQGVISFSNLDLPRGVNAPFYDADGTTRLSGDGFRAALYAGPPGAPPTAFVPLGMPQPFRTGNLAGYWMPANVAALLPSPGSILVQVRFWDTQGGTLGSFEQALAAGAKVGFSLVLQLQVPMTGSVPLTGLRSASLIPAVPPLALGDDNVQTDLMAMPNGWQMAQLCSRPVGLLRWFQLRFADTGEAVVHTDGSSIDTIVSVFTSCLLADGGCSSLACNDDRASGQTASEVRFPVEPNVTYLLAVGGANGVTGSVQLTVSLPVRLAIEPAPEGGVTLSWPAAAQEFVLESAPYLSSALWQEVDVTPEIRGDRATVRIAAQGSCQVYRLKRIAAP